MPEINGQQIDFDAMSDDKLKTFLDALRQESSNKRPRLEAKPKEKGPKKEKTLAREVIKVDL